MFFDFGSFCWLKIKLQYENDRLHFQNLPPPPFALSINKHTFENSSVAPEEPAMR